MKSYLKKLMNREDLTIEETEEAVSLCFESTITDTEMAAFLTALKVKGETSDEMTGIVNTVRYYSEYQSVNYPGIMDNCGTGGDQSYRLNRNKTPALDISVGGV